MDHADYPPGDYSRTLLAGTERYYDGADKLRAEVKALPDWGTRDFDHTAWAARPRKYQDLPPGSTRTTMYTGAVPRQAGPDVRADKYSTAWERRCSGRHGPRQARSRLGEAGAPPRAC